MKNLTSVPLSTKNGFTALFIHEEVDLLSSTCGITSLAEILLGQDIHGQLRPVLGGLKVSLGKTRPSRRDCEFPTSGR